MLFRKVDFDTYWDRILDACEDTGVGSPEEDSPSKYKKLYDRAVEEEYKSFAKWLYKKKFDLDKEIDIFNNKYLDGMNSREASYQVLTYEYDKWAASI